MVKLLPWVDDATPTDLALALALALAISIVIAVPLAPNRPHQT